MSKLITVLLLSVFSLTALANSQINSLNLNNKIESRVDNKIDKHQAYMDKMIEKSIDKRSQNIINDIALDIENY
ncbi:MAG: hypothetical protein MJK12_09465 [Colwellia sp.]|nr:hypothetical protein [Colwellia sp.]